MKKYLICIAVLVLLSAGAFYFFTGSPTGAVISEDEMSQSLFVPLEQTQQQRLEFTKEFKTYKSYQHIKPLYEKYIDEIGANGLIHEIEALHPKCHDEGHDLGKVIYAKLGSISESLANCKEACYSGCMHGVFMGAFADDDSQNHISVSQVKEHIPNICYSDDMKDYKPGDCAHGVGHAGMFLSGYDIEKAIEVCDLFDTEQMKYYCATGAYMEYVNENDEEDAKLESIFYPCDVAPYPAACFRYKMVHVFARHYQTKGTLKQIADQCAELDGNVKFGCFHGIGNGNMAYIAKGNIKLSDACSFGDGVDKYVCIEGAMERMGKYNPEVAQKRCITVTGSMYDLCLESVEHEMYSLEKSFEYYQK